MSNVLWKRFFYGKIFMKIKIEDFSWLKSKLCVLISFSFYLFLVVLGLRCCTWTFSSAWASHCGVLSCCRAQAFRQQ